MSVLLNDTGVAISWSQGRAFRRLVDGGRATVDPSLPLLVKLSGYTRPVTIDIPALPAAEGDDGIVYTVGVDDIPPPVSVVNVMNMVPYRIGVSVDGGPVYVSGDAILDVVSPGAGAIMKFHYPDNVVSEGIEAPPGDQVGIMIVVPRDRASSLSGRVLDPQTPIGEVVYAYSIDCNNRLTQTIVTNTGTSYVYVIDSDAPALPFAWSNPPQFWSYEGPVLGPGPDGVLPAEPLVPARVRVLSQPRTMTQTTVTPPPPPPPAPATSRSNLFWWLLAGIGIIALIGLATFIYWLSNRSDPAVVAIDSPTAFTNTLTF